MSGNCLIESVWDGYEVPFANYNLMIAVQWPVTFLIGGSTYSNNPERDGYVYINNSSFAFDFEGGVDYRLTPRLALRGAIGYLHSTLEEYGQPIPGSTPRQSAGYGREQFDVDVVYRF